MNVNKSFRFLAMFVASLCVSQVVMAQPGLDARNQAKVRGALGKELVQDDTKLNSTRNTVTNIGSKKDGTCSVNIGTVAPGQKAPKEIVVTTKEVINVCK